MANITSANAVLILSAPLLLPAGTQIQGFSTDDVFSTATVKPIETMLGVDGQLAAGWLFTQKVMTITLLASSPSNAFFDQLQAAQEAAIQPFSMTGFISLISLGTSYNLINGYLTSYMPTPDAKKVLQPRKYEITWQDIVSNTIGVAG